MTCQLNYTASIETQEATGEAPGPLEFEEYVEIEGILTGTVETVELD